MELSSFLQRLSYEVSSALDVSLLSDGFTFQRIDPTLNLARDEASSRLPWPIPTGVVAADPMSPAYQVRTDYRFNATEHRIERTSFSETYIQAVNIGEFLVDIEPGGRILAVTLRPKEMTAAVKARILLPVVTP
jgi:hypothetical protein